MTEADWHAGVAPYKFFRFLRQTDEPSDRKCRLFGVECCRRAVEALSDHFLTPVIDGCERYADQPQSVRLQDLRRIVDRYDVARIGVVEAEHIDHRELSVAVEHLTEFQVYPDLIADGCMNAICGHDDYFAGHGETLFQFDLLRDIFGNPFRPVAFAPAWRTPTAVALAESMYQSRDFGPMPVLADALEEAGCDSPDVLSHCRSDGPHVRGCWVVDLVLGKA